MTVPAGATNATTAVSSNSYFQFTLTPNGTINLTNMTFGVGGNNAPSGGVQKEGYVVRSSADGYASNLASGIAPVQFSSLSTITVDLSAAAFQNLNSAVTFRIYGFINTSIGAERDPAIVFNNITFNGTVAAPPVPEINLKGNGNPIANNSFSPSTTNDTDFGFVAAGSGAVEKTYTIENLLGTGPLNLTGPQQNPVQPLVALGGTDAASFSVTAQPSTPIAGGSSTTFKISFNPSTAGTKNASVTIANDDADEGSYLFLIRAATCISNPVVTTTADSGAGSLREAIANACPGATITFASPLFDTAQTITLTSGVLTIDKDLTINGPGAKLLTINGNNADRVFLINANVIAAITGVTITGGSSTPVPTLFNTTNGGGIFVLGSGQLTLNNCTIFNNATTSGGNGGGICNNGTLTVTNSTISGNTTSGDGGGILNNGINSTLTVTNSTISGNTASNNGGGISSGGTLSVGNSTITNNSASAGGGIINFSSMSLKSSIVAGNTAINRPDLFSNSGTSQGYNLFGSGTISPGFTTVATDILASSPGLGPLADNGGSTLTHTPLPGSPALDKGNAFGQNTDQIGQVRPNDIASIPAASGGDNSDIGAYEVYNTPPTVTPIPLARVAGSSPTSGPIANVTDLETPPGDLTVTINDSTSATLNGVRVSNLINANGTITAQVVVDCTATTATFTLKVTDGGGLTATAPLTVTVTPNTPPAVSYANQTVTAGTTPGFGPSAATDNGAITGFALQGISPASGLSLSVNPANGQVTVTGATIAQAYTVVIRATDNCGAHSDAQFTVNVVCPTITFVQTNLPGATVNAAYNQSLTALPAGGNYTFAVTSGLLPQGLTLNSNGSFSGAPTQSGTFNFRVTATGFGGCTSFYDYVLTVACSGISITTNSLPGGSIGTLYNQTVTASPAATYSFTVSSGTLPPGLTLNAASGEISGTPTTSGSFNFTVSASSNGCSASQSLTIVIGCATATLTPGSLPAGQAGQAYSQTFAVNPAGSYTFSISLGSLPAGLTFNAATGVISGTPTTTGTSTFTLKAQSANGCETTGSYTLVINCPIVSLNPATLPNGTSGTAYSQTVTATPAGGNYSLTVSAGSLPPGLNLNASTGLLSGTPGTNGSFTFTVTATGFGGCSSNRQYTVQIGGGGGCQTITLPASLPNGSTGQLFSQSVAASPAGAYSYAVTAGSLPAGLTLYPSFGLIFGYPLTSGSYAFTITATGAGNCTASQQYSVLIGGASLQLPSVNDFGGDKRSDFTLWRASQAQWLILDSVTGAAQTQAWGETDDVTASGDYDGDGKADLANFGKDGRWRIRLSNDDSTQEIVWGQAGDEVAAGDYDGDGKTDLAVWRGAESAWHIRRSSDGQTQTELWGSSLAPYNDLAVPGDYDGDGKTDVAVFRRGGEHAGYWFIKQSSDGKVVSKHWGLATDTPMPGDYDGDGKADIAVWRGSAGGWYFIQSTDGAIAGRLLGSASTDLPMLGDYDGDGKADITVWRKSEGRWYILQSLDGTIRELTQGQAGDIPAGRARR